MPDPASEIEAAAPAGPAPFSFGRQRSRRTAWRRRSVGSCREIVDARRACDDVAEPDSATAAAPITANLYLVIGSVSSFVFGLSAT
jgi:hypothetical protein